MIKARPGSTEITYPRNLNRSKIARLQILTMVKARRSRVVDGLVIECAAHSFCCRKNLLHTTLPQPLHGIGCSDQDFVLVLAFNKSCVFTTVANSSCRLVPVIRDSSAAWTVLPSRSFRSNVCVASRAKNT